jgi:L-erythro-3,5-diaminohexanoate dehydrogenase
LKLDASPEIRESELLIRVTRLNIDSASFTQLKEEAGNKEEKVRQRILEIVAERGKMHNPVTGSGGMLIGYVEKVGNAFPDQQLRTGMKIATLVSLTLTPLKLEAITNIDMNTGQVEVEGSAILFASGPYAVLPEDLPERVALAALDVCGAPAQVKRLVKPTDTVVILGAGGKSGLLSLYQAWKIAGDQGKVIALEASAKSAEEIRSLNIAHEVIEIDATNPVAVLEAVYRATDGELADITFNCVNVPNTELPSVIATKQGGIVYFFSTAVRFTAAALGAEGIGKDVQMMIGNGYAPGHAELTLNLLREFAELKELFAKRYAK